MECDDIVKQLCDELAEDIDSEVCESIRAHLEKCQNCRDELGSVRNTVKLFRCLEEKDVPASIHDRLMKILNVVSVK